MGSRQVVAALIACAVGLADPTGLSTPDARADTTDLLPPVRVIAGDGQRCADLDHDHDPVPGRSVCLGRDVALAEGPNGSRFLLDSGRLLRVSAHGLVTTLAGGTTPRPFSEPAIVCAGEDQPSDTGCADVLTADRHGRAYVVLNTAEDSVLVRRIDPDGSAHTVAGRATGCAQRDSSYPAEGIPAGHACLGGVTALAVDANDSLWLALQDGERPVALRRVTADGRLVGVVPSPDRFCGPDDVRDRPHRVRCLSGLTAMAATPGGSMLLGTDDYVLRVDRDGTGRVLAGRWNEPESEGRIECPVGRVALAACIDPISVAVHPTHGVLFTEAGAQHIYGGPVYAIGGDGGLRQITGPGPEGPCGSGNAARDACVGASSVAVGPQGRIDIVDAYAFNDRLRSVDRKGRIRTVVGGQQFCGDGGPARDACLHSPRDIAADPSGGLLIADGENNRVRRIDPTGQIATVAGSGAEGFCGDGGPALEACLDTVTAVASDPETGDLYLAVREPETGNGRVRRVDRDTGTISSVAGRASCGAVGGPALRACVGEVTAMVADRRGGLYLGDHDRVGYLDPDGTIRTVVGAGSCAGPFDNTYLRAFLGERQIGDGGPATEACVGRVGGLALTADGNLLIADGGLHRLREVDRSGTIRTVAGNGLTGENLQPLTSCTAVLLCTGPPPCPAEGPALAACLPDLSGVAVGADGSVYLTGDIRRQFPGTPATDNVGYGTLWRLRPDGRLGIIAGNPYQDCRDAEHAQRVDGVPGRLACLAGLSGVAADRTGRVVVTDSLDQALAVSTS